MLSEKRCISGECRCGGLLAELHALSTGLTSKIESGVSATASTSTAREGLVSITFLSPMDGAILLLPP